MSKGVACTYKNGSVFQHYFWTRALNIFVAVIKIFRFYIILTLTVPIKCWSLKRKRTNLSIWNKLLVVYAIFIVWFSWKFEWPFSNWHNKSKVKDIKIYGTCIYLKHSYWKSRIAQLSNKNEQLLYQSSLEKFLTRNLVVIDLRFSLWNSLFLLFTLMIETF